MSEVNLLVGMTGSIGMVNMSAYLLSILNKFPGSQFIMTHTAQKFISKETFLLFSKSIHSDMFESTKSGHSHINLADWADIIIVIPATAHLMAQVAHGSCGNFLSTTILAHTKPVLFFPNMNNSMWINKATQRNIAMLMNDGHQVILSDKRSTYVHSSAKTILEESMPTPPELVKILFDEIKKRELNLKQSV